MLLWQAVVRSRGLRHATEDRATCPADTIFLTLLRKSTQNNVYIFSLNTYTHTHRETDREKESRRQREGRRDRETETETQRGHAERNPSRLGNGAHLRPAPHTIQET